MTQELPHLNHRCWCGRAAVTVTYLPELHMTRFRHNTDEMMVPDDILQSQELTWDGMVDGFLMTCHQKARRLSMGKKLSHR